METPSSARRVTRSQTKASSNNSNNNPISWKIDDSTDKGFSKSRNQQDRSALIDITNDSPIVGLAMGSLKTPSSALAKKNNNNSQLARHTKTPGSGEALLRSHITTLLQKVEEESEVSKFSLEDRPFLHLKGFLHSPAGLVAPTPANTPHDLNLSGDDSFKKTCLAAVTPSPVQEQLQISQVMSELLDGTSQEKSSETESCCYVTRSLLQDFFSENSEGSADSSACYSVLSFSGGIRKEKSPATEDDNSSVWSMQVNASTAGEEEDDSSDEAVTEVAENDEEDYHLAVADYDFGEAGKEGEDDECEGWVDALCEGISNINVTGERRVMPKFAGKHTRFVYNSDDELVEVEDDDECDEVVNEEAEEEEVAGLLRLKGLPTPEGKHLRFHDEC